LVLTHTDYSLRERADLIDEQEDDTSRQLTLKLRTPDLSFTAMTDLPGSRPGAKTKLEEDIAPIAVVAPAAKGKSVALAEPRSIRSRFSLSTSQSVRSEAFPKTLGALFGLYPTLKANLKQPASEQRDASAPLRAGPDIDEVVLTGAEVDLGQSVKGSFALTLWYFLPERTTPKVAEISFRCALDGGQMPRAAAGRALSLFIGMQEALGGAVNLSETSKTALALPH
jgi:hypothetical protein